MDSIDSLPIKNNKPSPEELNVLDKYFKEPVNKKSSWAEIKSILIAGILYLILSHPFFDKLIEYFPNTGSWMVKYFLKFLIFVVILYISVVFLG